MELNRQAMVREALEELGAKATNAQIRSYAENKYGITLRANDIWKSAGRERDRQFNDVTVSELTQVKKDIRRYGSLQRLQTVCKAAECKGVG
jgi:8-oxo-dGTP pyrophosphatase MutT (NUDIX family)